MRADRLVSLIIVLQQQRLWTARQLAERLEVSERTILRDMDALSAAGIPIYAERGAQGGFRLLKDYRLDLSGLRTAELAALLFGTPQRLLADLGWQESARSATEKFQSGLSIPQQSLVDQLQDRFHVDETPWFGSPRQHPTLDSIQNALWHNQRLQIVYSKPNGSRSYRLIEPYGLVAKVGTWYLVAAQGDQKRVFRVSRIHSASLCSDVFERPTTFHLQEFWDRWSRKFEESRPRYPVVLIIEEKRLREDFCCTTSWPILTQNDPAHLTVLFETQEAACRHLLGFRPGLHVLDPPDLRIMMAQRAQAVWESLHAGP